jgi:hypothetical protein
MGQFSLCTNFQVPTYVVNWVNNYNSLSFFWLNHKLHKLLTSHHKTFLNDVLKVPCDMHVCLIIMEFNQW